MGDAASETRPGSFALIDFSLPAGRGEVTAKKTGPGWVTRARRRSAGEDAYRQACAQYPGTHWYPFQEGLTQ